MVPLEDVAIYAAPLLVVFSVIWFLYKFIRGEFKWQIKRKAKKYLLGNQYKSKK